MDRSARAPASQNDINSIRRRGWPPFWRPMTAMAGAVHNFHLWYQRRRPIPFHERAVDYALAQPAGVDSACIDVDLVDLLVHAAMVTNYRRQDTKAWLRQILVNLLDAQNPDGGFYDGRAGVRLWPGWRPWHFRRGIGIGYRLDPTS